MKKGRSLSRSVLNAHSQKVEKVQIQNMDFLRRGGVQIFSFFFSNVNADFKCFSLTKNKLVLK